MGTRLSAAKRATVLVGVVAVAFVGCGGAGDAEPSGALGQPGAEKAEVRSEERRPAATTEPASKALQQMEIAFEGNPSRGEAQANLGKAFKLYEVPITEENYSRAGSSLVALRKRTGVSEMEILREAIQLHVPGVALTLPDAFGVAAWDLATR